MKPDKVWSKAARWTGHRLGTIQITKLDTYRRWLLTEAMDAGGLGPNEAAGIDQRHLADSLVFAAGFDDTPKRVLDVGSGAGLPGIPLAIMMPDTEFFLLDRSGRRSELLRRARRVLDLENIQVVHDDLAGWDRVTDGVVSRGSLSPEKALVEFKRLLSNDGTAVLGGSWVKKPAVVGFHLLEVPPTVLDQRVWLLIMRRQ